MLLTYFLVLFSICTFLFPYIKLKLKCATWYIFPFVYIYVYTTRPRCRISSQGGGVHRHTVLPRITKRSTTNLKTKNNQNWQKIELYGSLTTKELKKKHSHRLVGGAEMGIRVERTCCGSWRTQWGGGLWTGWPHICMQINWEEQLGSETDHTTQGSSIGKQSLKNLWL